MLHYYVLVWIMIIISQQTCYTDEIDRIADKRGGRRFKTIHTSAQVHKLSDSKQFLNTKVIDTWMQKGLENRELSEKLFRLLIQLQQQPNEDLSAYLIELTKKLDASSSKPSKSTQKTTTKSDDLVVPQVQYGSEQYLEYDDELGSSLHRIDSANYSYAQIDYPSLFSENPDQYEVQDTTERTATEPTFGPPLFEEATESETTTEYIVQNITNITTEYFSESKVQPKVEERFKEITTTPLEDLVVVRRIKGRWIGGWCRCNYIIRSRGCKIRTKSNLEIVISILLLRFIIK